MVRNVNAAKKERSRFARPDSRAEVQFPLAEFIPIRDRGANVDRMGIDDRHLEAGILEPILKVLAVEAHMIRLPEQTNPFLRIGDARVFNCFPFMQGNENQSPAPGAKHTPHFPHGFAVIRYMFQNVAAVDRIKRIVRVRDFGDIEMDHGRWRHQVGGKIVQRRNARKLARNSSFGCEVKKFLRIGEQICLRLKKAHNQPMATEAAANGTE